MMTNAEAWLTAVLDCGIADLSVLDGCEYDRDDVVSECRSNFGKVTLNSLSATIISIGKSQLQDAIDDRLIEIEEALIESERNMDAEYRALLSLNPFDDIGEYHNFLDTSVWFEKNREAYETYLKEECDAFEQNTGYCLFN